MFELLLATKATTPTGLPRELGPGPTVLLQGDAKAGYFGAVSNSLLINQSTLNTQHGIVSGVASGSYDWLKFILDGNIYYISKQCSRINIRTTELRAQLTKTGKNIQIGGLTYLHRPIKGDTVDPSNFNNGTYPPTLQTPMAVRAHNSEWGRTLLNVCGDSEFGGTGKWAQFTKAQLGMAALDSNGACTICYEDSTAAGYAIFAGGDKGVVQRLAYSTSTSANWIGHRNVLILKQP